MTGDSSSKPPVPSHPLRWLPEFWELSRRRFRPQVRMMGLALVVGVAAGLGAILFYTASQTVVHYSLDGAAGYRPSHPGGEPPLMEETQSPFRPWMLLLIPTVGGIISGLLVFTLAPEAEGHGTDSAIAAFHYRQGRIRPRVPFVKLVAGALFAAEILYRSPDFESEVIVSAALASTAAYCTFGLVFGWSPLFDLSPKIVRAMSFNDPRQLLAYLLLALLVVVLAMLYTLSFYGLSHAFRRLPLPRHAKPAIGALATGLYLLIGRKEQVLSVMSFGYGTLRKDA